MFDPSKKRPRPKSVNIHIMKIHPIANINRDENGSPKTAEIGGTNRIRQTSQNQTYSMRFGEFFDILVKCASPDDDAIGLIEKLAIKTRHPLDAVKLKLEDEGKLFASVVVSENIEYALRKDSAFAETKEVTIYTKKELRKMFSCLKDWCNKTFKDEAQKTEYFAEHAKYLKEWEKFEDKKKKKFGSFGKYFEEYLEKKPENREIYKSYKKCNENISKIVGTETTIDIAMFGRMCASDNTKRKDGSTHVSHAFTTHEAMVEQDYFTAIDTVFPNSGAAHMNYNEFASGCFYKHYCFNTKQFCENANVSEKEATLIAKALIIWICYNDSRSKEKSYSANTYPELVYIETYDTATDIEHGNAFEKAVESDNGYAVPSIMRLKEHIEATARTFDVFTPERYWLTPHDIKLDESIPGVHNCKSLTEMLSYI